MNQKQRAIRDKALAKRARRLAASSKDKVDAGVAEKVISMAQEAAMAIGGIACAATHTVAGVVAGRPMQPSAPAAEPVFQ